VRPAVLKIVEPGAIAAAVVAEAELSQQRDQVREALERERRRCKIWSAKPTFIRRLSSPVRSARFISSRT
jgi:hypothetical protein